MKELNIKSHCPICDGSEFKPFLECVDYTVSQEKFNIVECTNCGMHFTNPIPVEEEIGAYYKSESYISHSSTNKGLINKIYQQVRKITLNRKLKLIRRLAKGKRVLDIGAGTGHFLDKLTQSGYDAIGLEPDADARQFAKDHFSVNIQDLSELYNLEKKSLDVVTMWHVLEHVYDLQKDVKQISELLKGDGVLVIAVPNMGSYDAKYYKEYWAAYDLPIHLYHFTPNDIKNLFSKFGFDLVEVLPMKFDSYYISMLSEKYRGGNIINAIIRGFISNIKAKEGEFSSQTYILKRKS